MKKTYLILVALMIALVSQSAEQFYTLHTVALGTNAIPANTTIALPITLATTIQTNPGTTDIFYLATNKATNFVKFTLPATNNLWFTNTFVESNTVVGLGTKTWSVAEAISFTNNTPYYVTNGAYYTYSNGVVIATNAASKSTNYQVFRTSALVPFTITGTNYTTVTNVETGASVLDVTKSASVAAVLSFKLTGAGTSPVGFGYHITTDGVLTNTVVDSDMFVAANGTSLVTTNVNLNVGPFGYINMIYLTNGNASAVTNLTLKIAQKVSAP